MRKFKIMKGFGDKRIVPEFFPWELLSDQNAQKFHSQTLSRLNERGGLSCEEIYCNVTNTPYRHDFDKDKILAWVNRQIKDFSPITD